ncbi:thioredoxin-domain-containing protein [Ascobolus immersus RN42]|uniref:Thioredoxin-domain-containing protein n=1 Tax=Ascobolus immersus RN42 TaxID=1160509 RepID=A0A3N4IM85_ASCIM|nr:thioredoxin-domain-containing protein [Ascobolus immersus RN42]
MRGIFSSVALLAAALIVPVLSTPAPAPAGSPPAHVAEIPELTAADFDSTIKSGYWMVKHYSPKCPHCIKAAPHYKAVHDYYTTTKPSPTSSLSFEDIYDFHFASVDCDINGDICGVPEYKINAYPTFNLYKDGKFHAQFPKVKADRDSISKWVEENLEKIKPGSRPEKFVFPKEGEVNAPIAQESLTESKPVSPTVAKSSQSAIIKTTSGPINPDGVSIALTAESFMNRVTITREPWFIKFYAPWCGHCQALAPTWKSMAREMRGKLNVGEVNCDVEKRLCKDAKLRGYPTLMFFQGGERVEYDGLRGFGDLVSFGNKAADAGIKELDLPGYEQLEKAGEEVMFLYFYDIATVSEDFAALERLTLSLIGHAPLFKTSSENLAHKFRVTTFPSLVAVRDGRPFYYPCLSPADIRNIRRMLDWMKSVWLPIVPELSAANSHEIMHGKVVILAILNRAKPEQWASSKQELKKTAMEYLDIRAREEKIERQELRDKKELKLEEAKDRNDEAAISRAKKIKVILKPRQEVRFAWVDGIFWDRWIRQTYGIDVQSDGERVIINDEDRKLYWDTTNGHTPIPISRSQILETLQTILENRNAIPPKFTAGSLVRSFVGLKRWYNEHTMLLVFLVIAAIGAGVWVAKKGGVKGQKWGGLNLGGWTEKDGLLGGNSAKYD